MKRSGMLLILSVFILTGMAYADCGKCEKNGGNISKMGHGKMGGSEPSIAQMCPVISKFNKKAMFLTRNQKAIGLSDEQVTKIKDLKLQVEKNTIAQDASMKTFVLDLNAKMAEPKVDVQAVNSMIDQQTASMAAQTKEVVAAYAQMKDSLSDDQKSKAKELWMDKSEAQCAMMKH